MEHFETAPGEDVPRLELYAREEEREIAERAGGDIEQITRDTEDRVRELERGFAIKPREIQSTKPGGKEWENAYTAIEVAYVLFRLRRQLGEVTLATDGGAPEEKADYVLAA